MAQTRSQKRKIDSASTPERAFDSRTPDISHKNMAGSIGPEEHPAKPCEAYCCRSGVGWVDYHRALDYYTNGPSKGSLDTRGRWTTLLSDVRVWSQNIRRMGLAPWGDLDPDARRRLESWSPAARQFWESDFVAYQEGIVQAWIWHYLDDNLFSFATDAEEGSLVKPSSPVWQHVRGLRRELDVLRPCKGEHEDAVYRAQFSAWVRMTEHLVRRGLGVERPIEPAHLVSHFKQFLRQLVAGDEGKFFDDAHDGDLDHCGDLDDPIAYTNWAIKNLLGAALDAQYFLHGMLGSYALRFAPIGSNQTSGFPFDENWMEPVHAVEVPNTRDDQSGDPLPPVQLVIAPMLVASGLNGLDFGRNFSLVTHMNVMTPWTFGGPEAKPFIRPGYEKGWDLLPPEVQRERRIRALKVSREQRKKRKQGNNNSEVPGIDGRQGDKTLQTLENKGGDSKNRPEAPDMDDEHGDDAPQVMLENDGEQSENNPEVPEMESQQGDNVPQTLGNDGEDALEALPNDGEHGGNRPEAPNMDGQLGDETPQTQGNDGERGENTSEALPNDGEQGDNTEKTPDMDDRTGESHTTANVGESTTQQ